MGAAMSNGTTESRTRIATECMTATIGGFPPRPRTGETGRRAAEAVVAGLAAIRWILSFQPLGDHPANP
ncbi:hypothetical protein GCM10010340_29660 [Streptomyces griseoloalbus]|nr:hypothetical protein GCM10010340_29660 [Streptomyces albaduncus]